MMIKKWMKRIFGALLSIVLIFVILLTLYCLFHVNHAEKSLSEYKSKYKDVSIEEAEDNLIIISNKEKVSDSALVFYPGALVEYTAYIPLLAQVAESGSCVYLTKMPLNMAIFDVDRAEDIMEDNRDVNSWYIGGHSMGAAMALKEIKENPDLFCGIISLGASTKYDISGTEIRMLSVYGSNDTIVGSSYEEYESNNSSKTTAFCLDGGNHAQFGDYGKQLGDSDATISADEQRSITADLIVDWLWGRSI